MTVFTIVLIIIAYLFGSLSSAIILAKLMDLPDPRTQGSNNPGATNMMRLGGKKAAALTLLGDVLKGVIPVLIAQAFNVDELTLMLVAFAAFIGHLYPVFFQFKGGKGVATAIGVLVTAHWPIGLFIIGVWLGMFAFMRISSLSALTAFLLAPAFAFLMKYPMNVVIVCAVITVLLFWRHRSNIQKLIAGTEGNKSR